MQYIAFDAHKRYTWACVESKSGKQRKESRIDHERGALRAFLQTCEPGSAVALETVGNWYWIVDEIEAARMQPRLVHAHKAKLMMGLVNKTDKLDARGMNQLQRNDTLPQVWIPPAQIRDQRELARTRMVLAAQRTRLKNRLHATLDKYALTVTQVSDLFGKRGKVLLKERLQQLPEHTRFASEQLLLQLESVQEQIKAFEARMKEVFEDSPQLQRIRTLPGVGLILSWVIVSEVGDIARFASPQKLASYAGTVPRVSASGGKVRHGPVRKDVNRYLKWAYAEAANIICLNRNKPHYKSLHVAHLYNRIRNRKGHQKAIGAVSRHLAEATYWMLTKEQNYQDPKTSSSKQT